MLTGSSSTDILNAHSVTATPYVTAEWNYNLFNPPHVTVAGTGTNGTIDFTASPDAVSTSSSVVKENFTTKKASTADGTINVVGVVTPPATGKSYKIVTYVRTNSLTPVIINTFPTHTTVKMFGSKAEESVSFAWTKIETFIGSYNDITEFSYNIMADAKKISTKAGVEVASFEIYFTQPEIYSIDEFNYQNDSIWSTDSAFSFFRPGESYVGTGDSNISFPANFRKVDSFTGYSSLYMPCSPVVYNPKLIIINPPKYTTELEAVATAQNPLLKNGAVSNISQYKYFASDTTNKKITAIYEEDLYVNKLVLKFNSIVTTPTVSISLTNTAGTTTLTGLVPNSTGELILYWDGSVWSTTRKWTSSSTIPSGKVAMPKFSQAGILDLKTTVKKITVEQTAYSIKSEFNNTYFTAVTTELGRMQLIEVSPRLEIDITNFVKSVNITKTLDNKSSAIPISNMESNDASITLSGIPGYSVATGLIPIFSNDSTNSYSILSGMLRRGVKLYTYMNISNASTLNDINNYTDEYIPTGVFYSDSWEQSDIENVSITCFDVTRLLQNVPVPDYAGQLVSIEKVITDLLDLAGFTDYDYDSLYDVTHDKNINMDLSYFFANSKDVTIFDALRQIFTSYQIAAYIDEYGIMQFLSLSQILNKTTADLIISDNHIVSGGYTLSTKQKPGKISMRYSPPTIKQSLALANTKDSVVAQSASTILTRSNEIVWSQQSYDSVGFNYLKIDMSALQNYFEIDASDLTDIFHTFNQDYDGYAIIEDEIVSVKYKEYTISKVNASIDPINVSIKNNTELMSYENAYQKENMIGIGTSTKSTLDTSTDNTIYDVQMTPTGKITNVQRGLFGTSLKAHNLMSDLASKDLYSKSFVAPSTSFADVTPVSTAQQLVSTFGDSVVKLVYPVTDRDDTYKTYSTSFTMSRVSDIENEVTAGLFFNLPTSQNTLVGAYFVGLKWDITNSKYYMSISTHDNTSFTELYSADVTSWCNYLVKNVAQVFKVNSSYNPASEDAATRKKYQKATDMLFTIKAVHDVDDTGNASMDLPSLDNLDSGKVEVLKIYLNNKEIHFKPSVPDATNIALNYIGLPRPASISSSVTSGTIFGTYYFGLASDKTARIGIREIYATQYPLFDESDSYFYKTQYFLNSIISERNITHKSYMMQTKPSASGIKIYDIEYSNPNAAATIVDVFPVQYKTYYVPSSLPEDKQYAQQIEISENFLKYSSPLNTGFRARLAVANNSSINILLKAEPSDLVNTSVDLTLFTHQEIMNSDDMVIEKELNKYNASEVAQIDTKWVQSADSANSILNNVAAGLEGFSKDVTLNIFGNPFIQVGDLIDLTYSLVGIQNKKYIVQSVNQSFDTGLTTSLTLNKI